MAERLAVVLVQVPERGLGRLLLIDLLRGLEQVLFRVLGSSSISAAGSATRWPSMAL
ncbi:MAG: hypothetical protein NTX53_09140 [candidate division WOR-3 bacterium]|nr:hypothetical protein [candidate division WOR-3 bacterium]